MSLIQSPSAITFDPGYRPHRYQRTIHERMRRGRFSVWVCHRRFGKTTMMLYTLGFCAATQSHVVPGRYAFIMPWRVQAKAIAWPVLKRMWAGFPGVKPSESDLSLTWPTGNQVRLYGADNPDALRGHYHHGVVCDEFASWRPGIWEDVLYPSLTDYRGWGAFVGTCKGINQFHALYERGLGTPGWTSGIFRADETDLPWLGADVLEEAQRDLPGATYRQEFLCDFNSSSDNILITLDLVSAAMRRQLTERELAGEVRVVGVDPARFGDDRTVILRRWGRQALEPIVLQGLDNMAVVGRVAGVIQEFRPDAVFVDGGRGEGIIDRLRQLGHRQIIEVQFGGQAGNDHYANKKTEMWDATRQWLEAGGALAGGEHASALKAELSAATYGFPGAAGKMRLASKDETKAQLGRSPDIADALALTFAFPVVPQAMQARQSGVRQFNPFAL